MLSFQDDSVEITMDIFPLLQIRVTFTAFKDATLFNTSDDSVVAVSESTDTGDFLSGAKSCINSGVIGSTVKDQEIINLQSPVKIG